MRAGQLVLREIAYRKLNFMLGVLSVIVAVACMVGAWELVRRYDRTTEQLADDRANAAQTERHKVEEDFRKLTLRMGFTTVIVNQNQDLARMFAQGYAETEMPEDYGQALAAKKVATLNHILPTLQQRLTWPEKDNAPIQLIGVKGEVYIQAGQFQKPLLEEIKPGTMVIGKEVQRRLKLNVGDDVTLMGRDYKIAAVRAGAGSAQDIGVWVPLADVQTMLNKPGKINAILGIECMCPGDRVSAIRREINAILSDVQVYEFTDVATARSDARRRVQEAGEVARQGELAARQAQRQQRTHFTRLLVPMVLLACVAWIALLTYGNTRERSNEIGILRAIGLRSRQILGIFLARAFFMGLTGSVLGYIAGLLLGQALDGGVWRWSDCLANPRTLALAVLVAPLLACLASCPPAIMAALQDPAVVIAKE